MDTGATVVVAGGTAVVAGGVGGGACVRVDLPPVEVGVVPVGVVSVVVEVDVVPYEPLYWYCPCHWAQTGSVSGGGNGTSGRLPTAVSM